MHYHMLKFPGFLDRALTLSYDDGVIYDEKLIEIMSKNGLKGTFNLNSGRFSQDQRRLTAEQAVALYSSSGNEVAVHGRMHLPLAEVPPAMMAEDILNDRIALEELFGTVVDGMAYAYGSYSDQAVEVARQCGIQYARTIRSTRNFEIPTDWLRLSPTCHHEDPNLMELARAFVEEEPASHHWRRSPKLFYVWGHSYEFNDKNNWEIIEEFAEYIGNRKEIWYATNIEIYRYIKAFDHLSFSAEGRWVYNPSALDVYLHYYGKDVLVPAGATVPLERED